MRRIITPHDCWCVRPFILHKEAAVGAFTDLDPVELGLLISSIKEHQTSMCCLLQLEWQCSLVCECECIVRYAHRVGIASTRRQHEVNSATAAVASIHSDSSINYYSSSRQA